MDHKQRLKELSEFLQPYQRIWQNEIMLKYPAPLNDYPLEWVDALAQIRDKETLIELEKKNLTGLDLPQSLQNFYAKIDALTAVKPIGTTDRIPEGPFTFLYMIPKKEHEVRRLAPFVKEFWDATGARSIVDIGGGIGLLSQTLANQYGLPMISLDLDPVLQATGRDRHKKNSLVAENKVDYRNVRVSFEEAKFTELLHPDAMTIGLHTCGQLAVDQLSASAARKIRGIINFGCCFHKLPDGGGGQNISAFSRTLATPLVLEQYALTLASRAHRKMNEKDFDFKRKVKHFRYAFHFFMHDKHGKGMLNLGNSPRWLYDRPFSEYAQEQLKRVDLAGVHSDQELDHFFARTELQDLIWKMEAAGMLRNAMGRVLELYLLTDRVIYLEEQGYQAQLLEFFDEEISPRNLGVVAIAELYRKD